MFAKFCYVVRDISTESPLYVLVVALAWVEVKKKKKKGGGAGAAGFCLT